MSSKKKSQSRRATPRKSVRIPHFDSESSDDSDIMEFTQKPDPPVKEVPHREDYYGDAKCGVCDHEAWPVKVVDTQNGKQYVQNCKRSIKDTNDVWVNNCGASKWCTFDDPSVNNYGKSPNWYVSKKTKQELERNMMLGLVTYQDLYGWKNESSGEKRKREPDIIDSNPSRKSARYSDDDIESLIERVNELEALEPRIESLENRYRNLVKKHFNNLFERVEYIEHTMATPEQADDESEQLDESTDDGFTIGAQIV